MIYAPRFVHGGHHRHWPRAMMVAMRAPVTWPRVLDVHLRSGRGYYNHRIWDMMVIIGVGG